MKITAKEYSVGDRFMLHGVIWTIHEFQPNQEITFVSEHKSVHPDCFENQSDMVPIPRIATEEQLQALKHLFK